MNIYLHCILTLMFVPLLDLSNAELSLGKYWHGLWSLELGVGGGGGRRAEGGGGEKVGYSSATLSPPE